MLRVTYFSIVDTTPPEIDGCPHNIETTTELGTTSKSISWTEPTATDLSGNTTRTQSHQPGSDFPVGVTTVEYTFTDAANNDVTCTFSVTLEIGYLLILHCFIRVNVATSIKRT